MKTLILTLFILFSLYNAKAQRFNFNRRSHQNTVALDLQTGTTIFYGDVSRQAFLPQSRGDKKDFGTAFSFTGKVQNRKGIDSRVSWISGTLNGIRYVPNKYQVYFKNAFQEFDFTLAFDPRTKKRKFKKLNTSGVMGLGIINYRTQLRSLRNDRLISSIGYVSKDLGYLQLKDAARKTDIIGIAGFSVSYRIHQNFDFIFEYTYRLASSSKLDAIASGGFNDGYSFTSLGISYKIK